MYNLSGIKFRMLGGSSTFIIIGIIFILFSKFWKREYLKKEDLILASVCILFAIGWFKYHLDIINHPQISNYTGTFIEYSRDRYTTFGTTYYFSDEKEQQSGFCLDGISKKKIYPKDFQNGEKYKVYFEIKTETIVKVEEIKQ